MILLFGDFTQVIIAHLMQQVAIQSMQYDCFRNQKASVRCDFRHNVQSECESVRIGHCKMHSGK